MKMRAIGLVGAVLAVGLGGCSEKTNPRVETRVNQEAMMVGDLPSNPLKGKVITSWINKKDATMSTMFGNDAAWQYTRTSATMQYPTGSVLSVVTWSQQEDQRWFGGKIPQGVKSVEFVTVSSPGSYSYERYEGSPLKRVTAKNFDELDAAAKRMAYLTAQRAAVMP
jgi:hypothetical protein